MEREGEERGGGKNRQIRGSEGIHEKGERMGCAKERVRRGDKRSQQRGGERREGEVSTR